VEQIENIVESSKPLLSQNELDSQYYLKNINELRGQIDASERAAKKFKEEM